MNLVSLLLIILHPVIPPILSCAGVELVRTILLLPFLEVLIGQLVSRYSQLRSMYQPWVFTRKPLFLDYPRNWVAE